MALIKGKLIDPSTAIKQSQDPVAAEDLARKGYVDTKAAAKADAAELAAKAYADQKVADLVNGAPAMLDTLKELADAIEAGSSELSQEILTQVGLVDDKIDQEILDRQSAVSAEQSARELADQGLQGDIDSLEGVVQGNFDLQQSDIEGLRSDVDANSLAVSTEQSRAEGEESRIEGKIDQEVLDRQSAVSAEQSRAQGEEGRIEGKVDQEISDRQAAVSGEQSRAEGEESRIESKVDQEVLDRQSAVSAEQSARESADSALSGRISTLESATKPQGRKESKVMSSEDISNAYVDLAAEAMANTLMISVSGTVQYEGEDYSLSVVGGKTRVTFIGDLTPDGDGAALVAGDKVYFQYMVMA